MSWWFDFPTELRSVRYERVGTWELFVWWLQRWISMVHKWSCKFICQKWEVVHYTDINVQISAMQVRSWLVSVLFKFVATITIHVSLKMSIVKDFRLNRVFYLDVLSVTKKDVWCKDSQIRFWIQSEVLVSRHKSRSDFAMVK